MSSGGGQGHGMAMPSSPPYPPTTWSLGGANEIIPDIPISAVFLFLFICGAVTHMTIFQLNRRHGHKFLMSGILFGFCMARTVTMILRIASTTRPTNVHLAIAAQVFVAAGVVLIYIVNLIFTQRMLRAQHPHFGWHVLVRWIYRILYILIIFIIAMIIVVVVQSFYTLSPNTHRIDRDVQLAGLTFFAFVSFLPIPLVIGGLVIPRKHKLDKFGTGRWRTKIYILLTAAFLISFGASYRAGTAFLTPVPRTQPLPRYFHKAAFYIVNFTVEIIVVYLYAILRVDRRFHVPNGARGPGSYSQKAAFDEKAKRTSEPYSFDDPEKLELSPNLDRHSRGEELRSQQGAEGLPNIYTEEETFDGETDGRDL